MGTTRQAISHYYDECLKCKYRDGHDCIYEKRVKERCVWYRKKKNGYTLEEPKQTKCLLKDEENEKKMNKKEVLDAISREFRKSLQDLGVTNGEVIKILFPNCKVTILEDGVICWEQYESDWWNAPYKESDKV